MVEVAPSALVWLGSQVGRQLGGQLSGIIGDQAHTYGYHRSRNVLPRGDYSVQLSEDRQGDGNWAAGIDLTFSDSKMRLYTSRLKAAVDKRDPRIQFVREFYGTLNSRTVYGLSHDGSGDRTWNFSQADDTHLWHIHISILRKYANDRAKMQGLLDIMKGVGSAPSNPSEDDDMPKLVHVDLPEDNSAVIVAMPPVGTGAWKGNRLYISGAATDSDVDVRVAVNPGNGYVPRNTVLKNGSGRSTLWNNQAITTALGNGITVTFRRVSGTGKVSLLLEII